jgi:RNA polymerase sigma factor (sigma-70 family)
VLRYLQPRRKAFSQEELFELLKAGDSRAFNHFYSEVYPQAAAVLKQKGCPEAEREDFFQEALCALWEQAVDGRFTFKAGVKLSSYLVTLCTNRWIDRTRRVSYRNTASKDEISDDLVKGEIADQDHDKREAQFALMDEAFTQLGERCQEMLRGFYFEKISMQTLAETRGITPQTAKNEKYRCMQRLKNLALTLQPK